MITLAIASQKGGVGKTTIAINLSYALAKRGWRVALVDADSQGSVGLSLTEKARTAPGFYNMISSEDDPKPSQYTLETRLPELKLLTAGNPLLFDGNIDRVREKMPTIFAQLAKSDLDIVIVDCPTGTMGITAAIMRSVDYLLLPQQVEPLGVRTMPQMLRLVAELRSAESESPQVAGLILTMNEPGNEASDDLRDEVNEMIPSELMLKTSIPRDPNILRASKNGVPVGLLSRKPTSASLRFDQLASEMETNMSLVRDETENDDELIRLLD